MQPFFALYASRCASPVRLRELSLANRQSKLVFVVFFVFLPVIELDFEHAELVELVELVVADFTLATPNELAELVAPAKLAKNSRFCCLYFLFPFAIFKSLTQSFKSS